MKKVLVSLLVAGALVGGTTSSFAAATAKPSTKPAAGKEGTATHEQSESSATQKKESTMTSKATAKPMATAKAKKKK
ncbi:MAG: hypothetical protein RL470_1142 [Actinomycetota bacterium]|jgi:hypothetical protein